MCRDYLERRFIYLQQDKETFPRVLSLVLKRRHLHKHFASRREEDAVSPGPSGDQRAKVHSMGTFLIAGVVRFALGERDTFRDTPPPSSPFTIKKC